MRANWLKILPLIILLILGCKSDPAAMIDYLPGYWEISEVHRDGELVKSYDFSSAIDYFELSNDSVGFRKKVSPTLGGKYQVNDHQTPFTLKVEKGTLVIYYSDRDVTYSEVIVRAGSEELKIRNEQGLIYTYKPYEPIDFE